MYDARSWLSLHGSIYTYPAPNMRLHIVYRQCKCKKKKNWGKSWISLKIFVPNSMKTEGVSSVHIYSTLKYRKEIFALLVKLLKMCCIHFREFFFKEMTDILRLCLSNMFGIYIYRQTRVIREKKLFCQFSYTHNFICLS